MNLKALHMAPKNDHMEYSMWYDIVTTWSTPYGKSGVYILTSIKEEIFSLSDIVSFQTLKMCNMIRGP